MIICSLGRSVLHDFSKKWERMLSINKSFILGPYSKQKKIILNTEFWSNSDICVPLIFGIMPKMGGTQMSEILE